MSRGEPDRVSAAEARALLLRGQGLLDDPARRATPASLARVIRGLGYVQVDSINRLERAHHLILGARLDGYRHRQLTHLLERKRSLFEHWTHDASVIPTEWFAHWKPRFRRWEAWASARPRVRQRLGKDPKAVLAEVVERIREDGPLASADFEHVRERESKGWWDWKPQKMALEFHWRSGRLSIAGRRGFQKLYDLTERVLPEAQAEDEPDAADHADWAAESALARLGPATPSELAHFWGALRTPDARRWCEKAADEGRVVRVMVESLDGAKPRAAFALPDWRRRAARAPDAPDRLRLLAPFDPVLHDRKRTQRLFGFDYTLECFVPAAKRTYGYYVLPILEGERLVGRIEPRHDRDGGRVEVEKLWWEPGVRPTLRRRRGLDRALGRLADLVGAEKVDWAGAARRALR
ncbi:MAG: YcaQ family DNA glycosylase [Deltaproteobacteria bacterium]|nr:YcaQ family DNA glycosylase [Deltaproteobacteria bacterium]MBW2413789.1 YcaQ family DNA glycosylase [Deltaproteobacteria bacterium]